MLSILSKILDRAVHVQLAEYLKNNNLLSEFQSGLKAFDTVDHDIFCKKLELMGIRSVNGFRSYLSNRRQIVTVNGVSSEWSDISCGVPQGSILGPLLYVCYVNDISISVTCNISLYADDTALLVSGKNLEEISRILGTNLQSCNQWLVDNRLSMHLGKTECRLFGSKIKLKRINRFSVISHDIEIKSKSSVKYMGLDLDESLDGENTVNSIRRKVGSRVKFLYIFI